MNLVTLEGAWNVRDVGGYTTLDGRKVVRGKLYRSDGLDQLTGSDLKKLLNLGINQNIDLRGSEEIQKWEDKLAKQPDIIYHIIPLLHKLDRKIPTSLSELYIFMLEESQEEFKKIFRLILNNRSGVTLFHCSAGKDRTGLVAAFLLLLAGVPREEVVRDYCASEENIRPMLTKFAEENNPSFAVFSTSRPEDINPFLDRLESSYGGAEAYLSMIGMTSQEIADLKSFLIDLKEEDLE